MERINVEALVNSPAFTDPNNRKWLPSLMEAVNKSGQRDELIQAINIKGQVDPNIKSLGEELFSTAGYVGVGIVGAAAGAAGGVPGMALGGLAGGRVGGGLAEGLIAAKRQAMGQEGGTSSGNLQKISDTALAPVNTLEAIGLAVPIAGMALKGAGRGLGALRGMDWTPSSRAARLAALRTEQEALGASMAGDVVKNMNIPISKQPLALPAPITRALRTEEEAIRALLPEERIRPGAILRKPNVTSEGELMPELAHRTIKDIEVGGTRQHIAGTGAMEKAILLRKVEQEKLKKIEEEIRKKILTPQVSKKTKKEMKSLNKQIKRSNDQEEATRAVTEALEDIQ